MHKHTYTHTHTLYSFSMRYTVVCADAGDYFEIMYTFKCVGGECMFLL